MSNEIKYERLPDDIHRLTWLNNSRAAIKEGAVLYREINECLLSGETVCIFMDLGQSGALSIKQICDVTKDAGLRCDVIYRTAYLSDDRTVPVLMKNYASINKINGMRQFFAVNQEELAINWLLEA